MKGKKLMAVYLLMTLLAACFFTAPGYCDHPWDGDGDDDGTGVTGGAQDRGSQIAVGTPLSQSGAFEPVIVDNIGVSVFAYVLQYFFLDRQLDKNTVVSSKVERNVRSSSRFSSRRFSDSKYR